MAKATTLRAWSSAVWDLATQQLATTVGGLQPRGTSTFRRNLLFLSPTVVRRYRKLIMSRLRVPLHLPPPGPHEVAGRSRLRSCSRTVSRFRMELEALEPGTLLHCDRVRNAAQLEKVLRPSPLLHSLLQRAGGGQPFGNKTVVTKDDQRLTAGTTTSKMASCHFGSRWWQISAHVSRSQVTRAADDSKGV